MSYGTIFTMSSLQTALDAPSLVFLGLTGAGACPVLDTGTESIAVAMVEGACACQPQKSYVTIASPSEKSGLISTRP